MPEESEVQSARGGRPRDRAIDEAVLQATIKLLAEVGLSRLSMNRVAATAGVSKVTVYTRWASKDELIGAALSHLQVSHVPSQTGSVRSDLVENLRALRAAYEESGGMALLGNCLAEEPSSGDLLNYIRRSTVLPRRANFVAAVRAGVDRGEIRPDIDPERVASMVIGVFYSDHVAGIVSSPGWEESVIDDVLRGVGP